MKLEFTLRDLMWLTLVVALAMGWGLDSQFGATRKENYVLRATNDLLQQEIHGFFKQLRADADNHRP